MLWTFGIELMISSAWFFLSLRSARRAVVSSSQAQPAVSTPPPILFLRSFLRFGTVFVSSFSALICLCLFPRCARLHHQHHEMVYVSSPRPLYLKDRVAPVANRVCQVSNGDPLEVIEHGRRFVRVKT